MTANSATGARDGLFSRLRAACAEEWRAYTEHEFVRLLADGSLPEESFRHYLVQDYLFLTQFARAYALAAYKSEALDDIHRAAATVIALVETEMPLHVAYCAEWGLTEAEMAATAEATATTAYTRYVLDRGAAGDALDLYVALAPCVIGYAEIGRRLKSAPETRLAGNPYARWIEMYAGEEYQDVARGAVDQLDRLDLARGSPARFSALAGTFRQATVLEARFWRMGLARED